MHSFPVTPQFCWQLFSVTSRGNLLAGYCCFKTPPSRSAKSSSPPCFDSLTKHQLILPVFCARPIHGICGRPAQWVPASPPCMTFPACVSEGQSRDAAVSSIKWAFGALWTLAKYKRGKRNSSLMQQFTKKCYCVQILRLCTMYHVQGMQSLPSKWELHKGTLIIPQRNTHSDLATVHHTFMMDCHVSLFSSSSACMDLE